VSDWRVFATARCRAVKVSREFPRRGGSDYDDPTDRLGPRFTRNRWRPVGRLVANTAVEPCRLVVYRRLTFDNSFLDRLEAVGHVEGKLAETLGMRGPVSRAAGVARDFRVWQPYGLYPEAEVSVPTESEGDGYARLRTFMGEIHEALTLMGRVLATLPEGPVRTLVAPGAGIGVGAVEAAGGSLVYWIRLDQDGKVQRCIMPPALANWHAVPHALRHSAFQDVPIILATFGLSVAEADR